MLTWITLDSGLSSSLLPGGSTGDDVTEGGRVHLGCRKGGALDEGLVFIGWRLLRAADA